MSNIFVPGRGTPAWSSLLRRQDMMGPAQFSEDGYWWLPTSIPMAQAYRYFFAVKQWRVQINVTETFVTTEGETTTTVVYTHALDTGFIPFGMGADSEGAQTPWFAFARSSPAYTLTERLALANQMTAAVFIADTTIDSGDGDMPAAESAWSIGMGFAASFGYDFAGRTPLLVLDDSTPGHVFMPFCVVGGAGILLSPGAWANDNPDEVSEIYPEIDELGPLSPTGVEAYLDGMSLTLWGLGSGDSTYSATGTVSVSTLDTAD
jgi:hypothetical protein